VRRLVLIALAALAGCATVDVYRYEPRELPAGTQPQLALRQAVGDLEAISWGYRLEPPRGRVTRTVVDAPPGSLTVWTDNAAAPTSYAYRELPRYVRAVTDDSHSWTIWIARGPATNDLGLHFRSERAARMFLDAAHALASARPAVALPPPALPRPAAVEPPPANWLPAAVPTWQEPEPLDPYGNG
jgi:hypothetical protein